MIVPPLVGPATVEGVELTTPPWIFWPIYTIENWVGLPGILWGQVAFCGILGVLPFIDRSPHRHWRERAVAMILGAATLAVTTTLAISMLLVPAQEHLGM